MVETRAMTVGKLEIDLVPSDDVPARVVRATVEIGGSLLSIEVPATSDPEVRALVDQLIDRIRALALDEMQKVLQQRSH